MALIKCQNAASVLKDAIVLDLGDVAKQAQRLRESAQVKARQIIQHAENAADQLAAEAHEQAFEQGHTEGLEKGIAQGRLQGRDEVMAQFSEQMTQLQDAWRDSLTRFDEQRNALDCDARRAVLDLALRFAEKLVHRIIEVDDSVIADQVGAALAHVLKPVDVTVRINPEDRPALEQAMPQLLAEFDHLKHVEVIDDPDINRGGCIASYGQGRIDATVEKQLQRVVELMLPGAVNGVATDQQAATPQCDQPPVDQPPVDQPLNDPQGGEQ